MDTNQMDLSESARALADEAIASAKAQSERELAISNLAEYVRRAWTAARNHKQRIGVEERMRKCLRQRRGEYDADKLAEIQKGGGSAIYMMITSVKCRAATAWLRDIMTGTGSDKPWTVSPTPVPELPPMTDQAIRQQLSAEVGLAVAQGIYPTPSDVQLRIEASKKQLRNLLEEKARIDSQDTERRLEDVLVEGGFNRAMDQVLDDLVTFPAAIVCGPMVRRRPTLQWVQSQDGWTVQSVDSLVEEYERVSPFDFYPDPDASNIEEGFMIRVHKLTTESLSALRGSPGYNDDAIKAAMDDHMRGGLKEWMTVDERTGEPTMQNIDQVEFSSTIDTIEFWGAVPGRALMDWGLTDGVTDEHLTYNANVWLIAGHVIKAVLNPDPLGKKPYAKGCYEEIPGSFWGNGVPDLIRDVQTVCNAAARAMVNNMGVASGPQVWINVDRLPPGEDITQMFPWKIWQTTSDAISSSAPPMDFFQPNSNANELMAVYEKFSLLADEYSGLPKYMAGDNNVGGAARTASGLSMLMGNANKLMKHVVGNIDRMLENVLQRTHLHLIYHKRDPLVKGDVKIVARGVLAVMVKDTMQLRRQELLTQTANPIDMQILGLDGRAALWRENLRGLGVNPDAVIPPPEVLKERQAAMQMQMAAQQDPMGGQQQQMPPDAQTDPMQSPMTGGYPGDMGLNA